MNRCSTLRVIQRKWRPLRVAELFASAENYRYTGEVAKCFGVGPRASHVMKSWRMGIEAFISDEDGLTEFAILLSKLKTLLQHCTRAMMKLMYLSNVTKSPRPLLVARPDKSG